MKGSSSAQALSVHFGNMLMITLTLTLGRPTSPILRLVLTLPKRAAPVGAFALAFGGMLEASHKLVNALSILLTKELSKCAILCDQSQSLTRKAPQKVHAKLSLLKNLFTLSQTTLKAITLSFDSADMDDAALDTVLAFLGPSWLLAGSVCKQWRQPVLRSSTEKQTSYKRALESLSTYVYAVANMVCDETMALAMGKYASWALIEEALRRHDGPSLYHLKRGTVYKDRLDLLLWLREDGSPFYMPDIWDAARSGSADCFIWFITHARNINQLRGSWGCRLTGLAAQGGSVRILEYMEQNGFLSTPTECLTNRYYLPAAAAANGHTAAAVWLHERGSA
jgi:hypothetical protein